MAKGDLLECRCCGGPFRSKGGGQRFCSRDCRLHVWNARNRDKIRNQHLIWSRAHRAEINAKRNRRRLDDPAYAEALRVRGQLDYWREVDRNRLLARERYQFNRDPLLQAHKERGPERREQFAATMRAKREATKVRVTCPICGRDRLLQEPSVRQQQRRKGRPALCHMCANRRTAAVGLNRKKAT